MMHLSAELRKFTAVSDSATGLSGGRRKPLPGFEMHRGKGKKVEEKGGGRKRQRGRERRFNVLKVLDVCKTKLYVTQCCALLDYCNLITVIYYFKKVIDYCNLLLLMWSNRLQ